MTEHSVIGNGFEGVFLLDVDTASIEWMHPDSSLSCVLAAVVVERGAFYCADFFGRLVERDLAEGNPQRTLEGQNGHSGQLWSAHGGTELVAFGGEVPVVSRWRLDGSGPITRAMTPGWEVVAHSPDGTQLLLARLVPRASVPSFKVVDVATGADVATVPAGFLARRVHRSGALGRRDPARERERSAARHSISPAANAPTGPATSSLVWLISSGGTPESRRSSSPSGTTTARGSNIGICRWPAHSVSRSRPDHHCGCRRAGMEHGSQASRRPASTSMTAAPETCSARSMQRTSVRCSSPSPTSSSSPRTTAGSPSTGSTTCSRSGRFPGAEGGSNNSRAPTTARSSRRAGRSHGVDLRHRHGHAARKVDRDRRW